MSKRILVTGGNAGIGLALCTQLVLEHGCEVFLGSRNAERGEAAVSSIRDKIPANCAGSVELVNIDVASDESVAAAAAALAKTLNGQKLYALVNNAGTGGAIADSPESVMNVNFHGVKRVVDSFGSLLTAGGDSPGRIVNVGSGAGPGYVKNCSPEMQALLCNPPSSWDQLLEWAGPSQDGIHGLGGSADSMKGYGLSKALLHSYTMLLAKEQPQWATSVCSPGFINTKLTAGFGASKAPEEGTAAIRQLLFEPTRGNGWYFGSDGARSPYHFMRNPGEPEYDGVFHPPTNA